MIKMINKTIDILEFNKIQEVLAEYAISENAKNRILNIRPILNETELKLKQRETTEAKIILENIGSAPICAMKEVDKILHTLELGGMLEIEELEMISGFINSNGRLKRYLKKAESLHVGVAFMGNTIADLTSVYEEIEASIRNGTVLDSA
jgi:dsDNA-specific endonuclease/ATPase MutS2